MYKCNPLIKTPWCEKEDCNLSQEQHIEMLTKINKYEKIFKEILAYEAYSWSNDGQFNEGRIKELKIQ